MVLSLGLPKRCREMDEDFRNKKLKYLKLVQIQIGLCVLICVTNTEVLCSPRKTDKHRPFKDTLHNTTYL
jgi:hypothetical protein